MSWVTNTIVFFEPSLDVEELVLQARSHDRVHGRERLVHEHHRWVRRQCARDTDALALTAGQLGRIAVEQLWIQVEDLASSSSTRFAMRVRRPSPAASAPWSMFWRIVRCGIRPVCWIT